MQTRTMIYSLTCLLAIASAAAMRYDFVDDILLLNGCHHCSVTRCVLNRCVWFTCIFHRRSGSGNDICGDPSIENMTSDPMKIVDYLTSIDSNKNIEDQLKTHPFIKTLEDGKLSKDKMKEWVVQTAYSLQRDTRSRATAYGLFGVDFPDKYSR